MGGVWCVCMLAGGVDVWYVCMLTHSACMKHVVYVVCFTHALCLGRFVGGSGAHVRWCMRALVRMRAASRGLPNNLSSTIVNRVAITMLQQIHKWSIDSSIE